MSDEVDQKIKSLNIEIPRKRKVGPGEHTIFNF